MVQKRLSHKQVSLLSLMGVFSFIKRTIQDSITALQICQKNTPPASSSSTPFLLITIAAPHENAAKKQKAFL